MVHSYKNKAFLYPRPLLEAECPNSRNPAPVTGLGSMLPKEGRRQDLRSKDTVCTLEAHSSVIFFFFNV